jgi:hypothetical protein
MAIPSFEMELEAAQIEAAAVSIFRCYYADGQWYNGLKEKTTLCLIEHLYKVVTPHWKAMKQIFNDSPESLQGLINSVALKCLTQINDNGMYLIDNTSAPNPNVIEIDIGTI